MKIYDTYQEAKIENPGSDIYMLDSKTALMNGKFQLMLDAPSPTSHKWRLCKPADYLPSLEWFFDEGHKLSGGDLYIDICGRVRGVKSDPMTLHCINLRDERDNKRYILRAAALTETKVITETPEEKEAFDAIKEIDLDRPVIRSSVGENESVGYRLKDSEFNDSHEWKNGDRCVYCGEVALFIGLCPSDNHQCAIELNDQLVLAQIEDLSKPESPEQKAERERLEAAYDLYCYAIGSSACMYPTFVVSPVLSEIWCRAVDKANYRKEQ